MDTKKTVTIRLSPRQVEIIEDAAKKLGMQRTEFIRAAALSYAFTATGYETWQPLLPEFYAPIDVPRPTSDKNPAPTSGVPNTRNSRRRGRRTAVAKGGQAP